MKKIIPCLMGAIAATVGMSAQNCSKMNLQWKADIGSTCNQMAMTMIHDQLDRPFLYVANKEAGLKIYDITSLSGPVLSATVSISQLGSLDVMNLEQQGNYLYLALGNSFTNPQAGGMAIIDIATPGSPTVTDYYVVPSSSSGGGIVKVEGDYAYLGAMQSGLVIIDISNKTDIKLASQFIPDINYPPVSNPKSELYNARGMEVKNSIVYLCYDAGGLRIINCSDKTKPRETGRWCNPAMYTPINYAKAYNNIVIDDTLVYIAVDYAGMEILSVADTSKIKMISWWNPFNAPSANWFNTPVHSNEIQFNKTEKKIFMSTGKSDMYVLDVSNIKKPDSCNIYGGVSNNLGTWGVGLYKNQIYLSYICALIPFSSNWTGVKILTYDTAKPSATKKYLQDQKVKVYPNPTNNIINIKHSFSNNECSFFISNITGKIVFKTILNNTETRFITDLSSGTYFYNFTDNSGKNIEYGKLIISKN